MLGAPWEPHPPFDAARRSSSPLSRRVSPRSTPWRPAESCRIFGRQHFLCQHQPRQPHNHAEHAVQFVAQKRAAATSRRTANVRRCHQFRRVNGRSRGVDAVLSCTLAQDGLPSAYLLDRPCVCPRAFPCIRPRIRPRSADCASARLFPPAPTCTCRRRHGADRGFCLSCWLSS